MCVLLYLADGFEEIEAMSVVDVLRRADIEIQTVSIMGKKEVTGAHNITVIADSLYEDVTHAEVDMLVLPGGGQGMQNMDKHAGVKEQIIHTVEAGKWVAAICVAPTILGRLGILKGKKATCYPGYEEALQGAYISDHDNTIVDDMIITSRGPGLALDFALTIVKVLKGEQVANIIRQKMIID